MVTMMCEYIMLQRATIQTGEKEVVRFNCSTTAHHFYISTTVQDKI
jgi:hypothetical protein